MRGSWLVSFPNGFYYCFFMGIEGGGSGLGICEVSAPMVD